MSETCKCIRCNKDLANIADIGLQPSKGLAFQTRGHYGSTYFDPMPEFGGPSTYLEIVVCDNCVKSAEMEGIVHRSVLDTQKEAPYKST
jgi:hypothetical protein